VQIDWWDREAWIVQDHATGTVRAYTDAHGEVVKQYRFDSFGNYLNQDTFSLAASGGLFSGFDLRLGHHGLFGERVDHHTNAPMFDASPDHEVWYQSRSRWYVPELGRFISSDPNATGVPVVSTLAMLGQMPQGPPSGSFDAMSHYGDGWDTWTAYGGNPIMSQDPTGLFILGFFSGSSLQAEMSSDYSDEALSTGLDAGMFGVNTLQAAANSQLLVVMSLVDPKMANVPLGTVNAAGQLQVNQGTRFIDHHIATNKGKKHGFKDEFQKIFKDAGLELNGKYNVMKVPDTVHRGRHPYEYHKAVLDKINADLAKLPFDLQRANTKAAVEARGRVVKGSLEEIRAVINLHPGFVHDTLNGVKTGFKGRRHMLLRVR